MKKLKVLLVALLATLFAFALVACDKGKEPTPSEPSTKNPPAISGPAEASVYVGYGAFSTEAFTVTGDDVTVTKTSGNEKITWNDEDKTLDVATGLTVGEYPVVLTASNGDTQSDKTATFTLKVLQYVAPSISGPETILLTEGYAKTVSEAFTVAGTNVSVTLADEMTGGKVAWNNTTKKLEIEAGLGVGTYQVSLTAGNGNAADNAVHDVTIKVESLPNLIGPTAKTAYVGYEAFSTEAYTVIGKGVTVSKISGDEKIAWNDEDKTLDVAAGLGSGAYPVVLKATNGNAALDKTLTFTLTVKALYMVSGSYAYSSGVYDDGAYKVDNDEVTVASGDFTATSVDTATKTYTIILPEGENVLTLTSKYFHDATLTVEVEEESQTLGGATFSVPKLDATDVTYNSNGFVLAKQQRAMLAGDVTIPAGEGFVVSFTMSGAPGTDWFNRGGFSLGKEGTNNSITVALSNGKALFGVSGTDWGYKSNVIPDYDHTEELTMTVVFYEGVYYVRLNDLAPFVLAGRSDFNSGATNIDADFFSTELSRTLGFGYSRCFYETTYSNVRYGIGNAAAEKALKEMSHVVRTNDVTVSDGGTVELLVNGNPISSGSRVFEGSNVLVKIKPAAGYIVKTFTVTGDAHAELDGNNEYTIEGVYEDVDIFVAFEQVSTYLVTGSYSYAMGRLADGEYTIANDTVTVTVGGYEATVNTENKTYTANVPEGTHNVVLSSSAFCSETTMVNVTTAGGTVEKVEFKAPKLDAEDIQYTDDGFTLGAGKSAPLGGNVTAAAGEGFVVSFTMSATESSQWFNRGGFYIMKTKAEGTPSRNTITVAYYNGKARFGVRGSDWGYKTNAIPDYNYNEELTMTVVFYEGVYYVRLNDLAPFVFAGLSDFDDNRDKIDADFFSTEYSRTLGFGYSNSANAVTYSNVYYGIGNEAAEKELKKMSYVVTVNDVNDRDGGTVELLVNGKTISSGSRVIEGSNVLVKVKPAAGYIVKTFTVTGDAHAELDNNEYTIEGVYEDMDIFVEFKTAPTYLVTGSYSYTSGRLEDGVYKNASDVVTVSVGGYEATVDTETQTYTVQVPEGEHAVVLSSSAFCDETTTVNVTEAGGEVEEVTFTIPKLEGTDAVYTDDGFTLAAQKYALLAGNVTAAAGEGFVLSFTMSGAAGTGWFNRGGFYIAKEGGVTNDITVAISGSSAWFGVKGASTWGYKTNVIPGYNTNEALKMTVVFYEGAYYVRLNDLAPFVLTKTGDFNSGATNIDAAFFSTALSRTLGFGYNSGSAATYSDIHYGIGDEAAEGAIDNLKRTVTISALDEGIGTITVMASGAEVHTGDRVFIGTELSITVVQNFGYLFKQIEIVMGGSSSIVYEATHTLTVSDDITIQVTVDAATEQTVTVNTNGTVENGSVTMQMAGHTVEHGGTVYKGYSLEIIVTPAENHVLEALTINGKDVTAEVLNNKYTLDEIEGDVTITVSFKGVDLYEVTGSYSYTSGRYDGGKYTNANDVITVRSGSFEGTGSDGTWSIRLPEGAAQELVITSKYFYGEKRITTNVTTGTNSVSESVIFSVPKFTDDAGVTYLDNGFSIAKGNTKLFSDQIAKTAMVGEKSEGFTVSYTIAGTSSSTWYNRGFLYLWRDVESATYNSQGNAVIVGAPGNFRFGLQWYCWSGSTWSPALYAGSDAKYFEATEELHVTVSFLGDEFYMKVSTATDSYMIHLGTDVNTEKAKFTTASQGGFTTAVYRLTWARTIGFGNQDNAEGVTYTNVSYGLGNEAAQAAIAGMGIQL